MHRISRLGSLAFLGLLTASSEALAVDLGGQHHNGWGTGHMGSAAGSPNWALSTGRRGIDPTQRRIYNAVRARIGRWRSNRAARHGAYVARHAAGADHGARARLETPREAAPEQPVAPAPASEPRVTLSAAQIANLERSVAMGLLRDADDNRPVRSATSARGPAAKDMATGHGKGSEHASDGAKQHAQPRTGASRAAKHHATRTGSQPFIDPDPTGLIPIVRLASGALDSTSAPSVIRAASIDGDSISTPPSVSVEPAAPAGFRIGKQTAGRIHDAPGDMHVISNRANGSVVRIGRADSVFYDEGFRTSAVQRGQRVRTPFYSLAADPLTDDVVFNGKLYPGTAGKSVEYDHARGELNIGGVRQEVRPYTGR